MRPIFINQAILEINRPELESSQIDRLKRESWNSISRMSKEARRESNWILAESAVRYFVTIGAGFCASCFMKYKGFGTLGSICASSAAVIISYILLFFAIPFMTHAPNLKRSRTLIKKIKLLDDINFGLNNLSNKDCASLKSADVRIAKDGTIQIKDNEQTYVFPKGLTYADVNLVPQGEKVGCKLDFTPVDEIFRELQTI